MVTKWINDAVYFGHDKAIHKQVLLYLLYVAFWIFSKIISLSHVIMSGAGFIIFGLIWVSSSFKRKYYKFINLNHFSITILYYLLVGTALWIWLHLSLARRNKNLNKHLGTYFVQVYSMPILVEYYNRYFKSRSKEVYLLFCSCMLDFLISFYIFILLLMMITKLNFYKERILNIIPIYLKVKPSTKCFFNKLYV